MKLLFDQNISPRLPKLLADIFPDSSHVLDFGLSRSTDDEIWKFALKNNFTIITKDEDFNYMSVLLGSPPKVIWLAIGNSTTNQIHDIIRQNSTNIQKFCSNDTTGTLLIG